MIRRRRDLLSAVVLATAIAVALLGPVGPAQAAGNGWVGRNPYTTGCASGARHLGTRQAWGPSGEVAAYIEVWHSDRCGTAWLLAITTSPRYSGTTSYIWNPNRPAQAVRLESSWYRTTMMVDDRPGMQTCLGTHVYRYGQWFAWRFHVCYF
jgi:hypothetical protein